MPLRKLGSLVGIACLLAVTCVLFPATPAAACTCAGPFSPADYLDRADVAFIGDVWATRADWPEQGTGVGDPAMIYTFDVQYVYKGTARERTDVRSSLDTNSCGAGPLQMNRRYLVYARIGEPWTPRGRTGLHTGLCDGTHEPSGVETLPTDDVAASSLFVPGDVEAVAVAGLNDGGTKSVPFGAFAGLMLLSGSIGVALIGLARRT